jgi:hypothetical protein
LSADAETTGLALVLGAELFGPSIRNALERAAVLVLRAVRVFSAARETAVIDARTACASYAFLRLRTWRVEAGLEALSIDTDTGVATLEVELASEGRRVGFLLERVETEAIGSAGGPHRALELLCAFADAAEGGADLPHGTICGLHTEVSLRGGLRVALVAAAQEAASIADGPVRNADVAGVVVAACEAEERDDQNPEAFHRRFDALAEGIFTGGIGLKIDGFRWITGVK